MARSYGTAVQLLVLKESTYGVPPGGNYEKMSFFSSSIGAEQPRDLPVPGRDLKGIHFAMDFLPQANKSTLGDKVPEQINAKDKHVVILGDALASSGDPWINYARKTRLCVHNDQPEERYALYRRNSRFNKARI